MDRMERARIPRIVKKYVTNGTNFFKVLRASEENLEGSGHGNMMQ